MKGSANNAQSDHPCSIHPLDPLTPEEIVTSLALLKARVSAAGQSIHFKHIALVEPPKREIRKALTAERQGETVARDLPRRASCLYYHRGTADLFLGIVNLSTRHVEETLLLEPHYQGHGDFDEVIELKNICINHPKVLEAAKKFDLSPEHKLACDTWPYGRDDANTLPRYAQCYMYFRKDAPGHNYYDNPLPFSPIFNVQTKELVEIIRLPTGSGTQQDTYTTHATKGSREYHHDLRTQPTRTGLRPLSLGKKWRFRLGFNWREGLILHDVRYGGRELFYRLSLAELFVPYGDPRSPYSRKSVFDLGDIGAGNAANDLSLGCDCLGHIKYFSFSLINSTGELVEKRNAVCMHEIDDGIGWKHTDMAYKSVSIVRSRVLALQSVITVGNYEYIFLWHFDQAAGLHFKIQATGIVSTAPLDSGLQVPWATVVNQGVMAPFHQHVFCLRIDPCIDGNNNTLIEEDSVPMPLDEELNPLGVGYVTTKRAVSESGFSDQQPNRVHKIINSAVINPTSGQPVAYAIHAPVRQMLLAHPESWHAKRAKYATHPFWVTRYRDGELYPAGDYTYQSLPDELVPGDANVPRKGHLGTWVDRGDNTENEDIVVWHSISLTHNPRTEDYPVMPCDTITVSLKPSGFFEWNPALDVSQSIQAENKSVAVDEEV